MAKGSMKFVKGIGTGMIVGAALSTVGITMVKNKKGIAKSAGKAVKAVGEIVDDIQQMMR